MRAMQAGKIHCRLVPLDIPACSGSASALPNTAISPGKTIFKSIACLPEISKVNKPSGAKALLAAARGTDQVIGKLRIVDVAEQIT